MGEMSWSMKVANLVVDGLVTGGVVRKEDFERALEITEEEIRVRLALQDYPEEFVSAVRWREAQRRGSPNEPMVLGPSDLCDVFVLRDGKMIAEGDSKTIDAMLATQLDRVRTADWAILYRHRSTGELWELTYPRSEMHGGGPRRLRWLNHADPDNWNPYQE